MVVASTSTLAPASSTMTSDEARECVEEIRKHLKSLRSLLLELEERQGWLALGYHSLRQCMENEFGKSQSQLYRQLKAGKIEKVISPRGEIGIIPEKHLRSIGKLPPQHWSCTWTEAVDTALPKGLTAAHIDRTVETVRQRLVAIEVGANNRSRYLDLGDKVARLTNTLVVVECPRTADLEQRLHYGCWGITTSVGEMGGVEVAIRGRKVTYMQSDLRPVDDPAPMLLEVARKVNSLFEREDLDELDRQILEFYVKRLNFTSKQLDRLTYLWETYS